MSSRRSYFVYITASPSRTIYVGITNDLGRRISEHKARVFPGFTAKYHVDRLVWFEKFDDPASAIAREKQLKRWRREKKIRLIEMINPGWDELDVQ